MAGALDPRRRLGHAQQDVAHGPRVTPGWAVNGIAHGHGHAVLIDPDRPDAGGVVQRRLQQVRLDRAVTLQDSRLVGGAQGRAQGDEQADVHPARDGFAEPTATSRTAVQLGLVERVLAVHRPERQLVAPEQEVDQRVQAALAGRAVVVAAPRSGPVADAAQDGLGVRPVHTRREQVDQPVVAPPVVHRPGRLGDPPTLDGVLPGGRDDPAGQQLLQSRRAQDGALLQSCQQASPNQVPDGELHHVVQRREDAGENRRLVHRQQAAVDSVEGLGQGRQDLRLAQQ